MNPVFFPTGAAFRGWLEDHHGSGTQLWVRLRKTSAAGPGVTYAEALDQALCFGWIDGVRHAVDGESFAVRFSPRKPGSIWSNVNSRHFERLARLGLIAPAGRAAFGRRDPKRTGIYSFESRPQALSPADRRTFQAHGEAWAFFTSQPPGYRRTATFWVVSAKLEATRQRRLARLIADSAQGRRLGLLV